MSRSRIMESDPIAKTKDKFHFDEDGDEFVLETVQDVQDIVDIANEQYKDDAHEGQRWKGDIHLVARVPLAVWAELEKAGIAGDDEALKKWLNDPDNRKFRTKPGRL